MKQKIALIGYSGHAFVVAEAVELAGYELAGYFEREIINPNPFRLPYLGFEENIEDLDFLVKNGIKFFISIGENKLRKRIMCDLLSAGLQTTVVIHPASTVSMKAAVGEGSFVAMGARVNALAHVGSGAILNTGCIVEHECRVGKFVHIAPGAILAGNVTVGDGSFIGAGVVIRQGIRIGSNAVLGAGAVVLKDVPDNQVWFGNPARPYVK